MTIAKQILKQLWNAVLFGSMLASALRLAAIAGFIGGVIGGEGWTGLLTALGMAGAGFWCGISISCGHIR